MSVLRDVNLFRFLRAQTLTVSFKKPWNYLAETNVAVRGTLSLLQRNSLWVELLDSARTHFESDLF
jgi:hypothetical protein